MQEIDVRTGLVMYEWTSLDHVGIAESYSLAVHSSTRFPYDFFHINSINVDRDGSYLISARNTWAIYDLQPQTGQILWRLGGKRSSFTGVGATAPPGSTTRANCADGSISIFDNGSSPTVHPQSRAIVVSLNPQTRDRDARRPAHAHAPAWSREPGQRAGAGERRLVPRLGTDAVLLGAEPERAAALRRPLPGAHAVLPRLPPAVVGHARAPSGARLRRAGGGAGTAYASWNGATGVASWRLLAGASAASGSLKPVLTVARSGFETALTRAGGHARAVSGRAGARRARAARSRPRRASEAGLR